jgi:hypothetical protein
MTHLGLNAAVHLLIYECSFLKVYVGQVVKKIFCCVLVDSKGMNAPENICYNLYQRSRPTSEMCHETDQLCLWLRITSRWN